MTIILCFSRQSCIKSNSKSRHFEANEGGDKTGILKSSNNSEEQSTTIYPKHDSNLVSSELSKEESFFEPSGLDQSSIMNSSSALLDEYFDGLSEQSKLAGLKCCIADDSSSLMFILNLLICNSVEILGGNYEGISQEELSFLSTLREYGFELLKRNENYLKIKLRGEVLTVDVLYTLDFNSKRQAMTTILKVGEKY